MLGSTGNQAAVVIMDNFKGQVTASVNSLLEANNSHMCLILPNTTDLLQPLDFAVNKLAKDFLKHKFKEWYSNKVMKQLAGVEDSIIRILFSHFVRHAQYIVVL